MDRTFTNKLSDKELSGPSLPSPDLLKRMGEEILSAQGRNCLKYRLLAKGGHSERHIFYLGRHKDVLAVTTGKFKNNVDLSQFDEGLASGVGEERFFLGANTAQKDIQWEILKAALDVSPKLNRNSLTEITDISRQATQMALDEMTDRAQKGAWGRIKRAFTGAKKPTKKRLQFNAVKAYGYVVPYSVMAKFIGLDIPKTASFFLRIMTGIRNLARPGRVRLEGQVLPAMQMLLWVHFIFGHLFANIGNRQKVLSKLALYSSKQFRKHIDKSYANADKCPNGSILYRLKEVESQFSELDEGEYARHVRGIVLELAGAMQVLVGTSFAKILGVLERENIDLASYVDMLERRGDIALDEALRLDTTTQFIFRVVQKPITIAGEALQAGDMICLLIDVACKDKAAFPNPEIFSDFSAQAPTRNRMNYLTFGPNEASPPNVFSPVNNTHPCFGQYWARAILRSMLEGLNNLPNAEYKPKTAPALKTWLGLPDMFNIEFDEIPSDPPQTLVTICSEISEQAKRDDRGLVELQAKLESLNNPASPALASAITDLNLIHFMSLHIIKGEAQEPDYLFLEMSMDGTRQAGLKALCEAPIWQESIGSIYMAAGCIKTSDQLQQHLSDNYIDLKQSLWPKFFGGRGANGIGFVGTLDLPLNRIRAEQKISEYAYQHLSSGIDHMDPDSNAQPFQVLKQVREKIRSEKQDAELIDSRWVLERSKAPKFSEVRGSPWLENWSRIQEVTRLFPAQILLGLFGMALVIWASMWAILFGKPLRPNAVCQAPCEMSEMVILPRLPFIPASGGVEGGSAGEYVFLNALPYALTGGIALLVMIAVSYIWRANHLPAMFKTIRKAPVLRGLRPFGYMFGLLALYLGLQLFTGSYDFMQTRMSDVLGRPDFTLWPYLLDVILAIVLAIFIYNHLFRPHAAAVEKKFTPYIALFLIVSLMVGLTLQQGLVFTLHDANLISVGEGSPAYVGGVVNRFPYASLWELIFLPLIPTLIVMGALAAYNASFPDLKFRLLTPTNAFVLSGVGVFVMIFITSFFTAPKARLGFHLPEGSDHVSSSFWNIVYAFGAMLPVFVLLAGGVLGLAFVWLSKSERDNTPHNSDTPPATIAEMMARENHTGYLQNHMLSVVRILPQFYRRNVTLPLSLSIMLTAMKKQRTRPGFLGSIGTVHFARWVHLPKTHNYVFASNYDGSFESYLEDFITKVGQPLNGAWSHCVGYPETENIFFKGSEDGDRFIRWARGSMRPTPFWYSAYPDLSAAQIRRNSLIRDGVARIDNASDAEAWLELFDSVARPETALQTEQIQSLVFGGAKTLTHGCCLVVEAGPEAIGFKAWLGDIKSDVSFGETKPKDCLTYLALSSEGLSAAGHGRVLTPDTQWTGSQVLSGPAKPKKFPPAFALGMHDGSRQRALGDVGVNAPEHWYWGQAEQPSLAVLLLYTENETDLETLKARHAKTLETHGLSFKEISLQDPRAPEPFGFKDGLSNPVLRGTRQAAKYKNSIHVLNAGEIVLGYKDNRGFFPPSPQVQSFRDKADLLPALAKDQALTFPRFQSGQDGSLRDLGRNGTYLVIRQLEQDTQAFEKVTRQVAQTLYPHEFKRRKTETAKAFKARQDQAMLTYQAQLMGRWQNGHSLVKAPVKTGTLSDGELTLNVPDNTKAERGNGKRIDNEFLYGKEDPQGHACPLGSHVRRSFPRDSLNPQDESELGISNRHRILRRGRAYVEYNEDASKRAHSKTAAAKPKTKKAEGIFFMCLNANIERQFEFVQQSWVAGSNFHGLRNEVDPITGQSAGTDQNFTIQAPGRDIRCRSMQSFVTMRGGGYFFMPGKQALAFIANPD